MEGSRHPRVPRTALDPGACARPARRRWLQINPAYKQALGPRAKLGLQLGRCAEAAADMAALKAVDPKARELRDEASAAECAQALHSAGHLEGRGDLHGAREALGLALALADSSHDLLVT